MRFRTALAAAAIALSAACSGSSGSSGPSGGPPPAPLTVVEVVPADGATGVSPSAPVRVTFSEAVDPATVQGAIAVAGATGTVTVSGAVATFTPAVLLGDTTYAARVTAGVRSLAGGALAADHAWSFTTGANRAPVAVAGADQDVATGAAVALDGSGSVDPDGAGLEYAWTQVAGPDVTDGAGALHGPAPAFTAPAEVATLVFDLTVRDGQSESAPDRTVVTVLRNPAAALFVAPGGDDTAAGTRAAPLATLG
ncbi:Ig-like domain-containing protein, partial [Anaeromyxobacter sp. PSR-1]|uniref:Ig-like domain-containing protein n=2 Tax=unclassified Anaeromyxobacter TaxID=2620896 RepID=UPI000A422250